MSVDFGLGWEKRLFTKATKYHKGKEEERAEGREQRTENREKRGVE